MKVKVVASNRDLEDIGLDKLISHGDVIEVTGSGVSQLSSGSYRYYEFSANVLGFIPTDGFRIEEDMVEVL